MAPHPASAEPGDAFDDVLAENAAYSRRFHHGDLEARAAKGLAVLTCMDSRLDPLRMLGLGPGDAKVLRNAGARVTEETLRALVLARHLLGVDRVMVVAHTGCAAAGSEQRLHQAIAERGGPDTRSLAFPEAVDQEEALRLDVQRVRSSPYLGGATVGGFVYDTATGAVRRIC